MSGCIDGKVELNQLQVNTKILNRIVFTNEKLYRLGIVDLSNCAFCHGESIHRAFTLYFTKSGELSKRPLRWLRDKDFFWNFS